MAIPQDILVKSRICGESIVASPAHPRGSQVASYYWHIFSVFAFHDTYPKVLHKTSFEFTGCYHKRFGIVRLLTVATVQYIKIKMKSHIF